jgi:Na+-transporting NADH:ubiquinone oxidoreductase subunit C
VQHSVRYTVGFAAAVCVTCSIFVASAAVFLKDRQYENRILDRQKKVLSVVGLMQDGEVLSPAEVTSRFEANVKASVVDLETGKVDESLDPSEFDQRAAQSDPERSRSAPPNDAKVQRLPNHALVYRMVDEAGALKALVLPVEGKGLWSTLYGYIALESDLETIRGITFYEHAETPGLGGEVDNPRWKALWPGRKAFGDKGDVRIEVTKGPAGPVDSDPHRIDGLSGATLTSRGVTHLVRFWLGEHGFEPLLRDLRSTLSRKAAQ